MVLPPFFIQGKCTTESLNLSFMGAQLEVDLIFNINVFIYSYFGCAGSTKSKGFSLVAASSGYSLVAMHRLLTAVASLAAEGDSKMHRLQWL